MNAAEVFAGSLRAAEERLRAGGLNGRSAYLALVRHLARRLGLPEELVPDGPDAPRRANLGEIPLTESLDLFGLTYERFFPDLFNGERGQYFTPRPVVDLMVALADIGPSDRVLDPTCGSGGFLVRALAQGAAVQGIELDPELVSLARLNLALAGGDPASVTRGNLFDLPRGTRATVVLANPPYSLDISDPALLESLDLGRGKRSVGSDALFLEVAWRLLEPGGRLCAVLPHSLLVNRRDDTSRQWLDQHFLRRAIVSLPEGVFRPFGGTATRACLVLLEKTPCLPGPMLVARIREPGFDTNRRRFRRTQPDELAALRQHLLDGTPFAGARLVAASGSWAPGDYLSATGLAEDIPTVALGDLVRFRRSSLDPTRSPGISFSEIDLGDLDKSTGEIARARIRLGEEFRPGQTKTAFREGDLLFGRMRPGLNNVGIASRPTPDLPQNMVGSSEWIPMEAHQEPWFALLALRSPFVRSQLGTTGGQTRPRARIEDLPRILVPDPGERLRTRLDSALREIHLARKSLRWRLSRIEAAYAAFGRGDCDSDALLAAIEGDSENP